MSFRSGASSLSRLRDTSNLGAAGLGDTLRRAESGRWEPVKRRNPDDRIITVGAGGDHPTVNDALAALSEEGMKYEPGGRSAQVVLLTGYEMAEQVLVRGLNLGWVTITAEDSTVPVARDALTTLFTDELWPGDRYPLFGAERGVLPAIAATFEMDDAGSPDGRSGILLMRQSAVSVINGGVRQACGRGIELEGASIASLRDGDFAETQPDQHDSAWHGALAANSGSVVNARDADLSGSAAHGVRASEGCLIDARGLNVSNAAETGVRAVNACTVTLRDAHARDCGEHGVESQSSWIDLTNGDVRDAASHGIYAHRGGYVCADAADASGAVGDGAHVERGGIIVATAGFSGSLSQGTNNITSDGLIIQ